MVMGDAMAELSKEELERARDIGAFAYLRAYVRLMARELGADDTDATAVNQMVAQIIEPMNHATEAMWRALMCDHPGMEQALSRFGDSLDNI